MVGPLLLCVRVFFESHRLLRVHPAAALVLVVVLWLFLCTLLSVFTQETVPEAPALSEEDEEIEVVDAAAKGAIIPLD